MHARPKLLDTWALDSRVQGWPGSSPSSEPSHLLQTLIPLNRLLPPRPPIARIPIHPMGTPKPFLAIMCPDYLDYSSSHPAWLPTTDHQSSPFPKPGAQVCPWGKEGVNPRSCQGWGSGLWPPRGQPAKERIPSNSEGSHPWTRLQTLNHVQAPRPQRTELQSSLTLFPNAVTPQSKHSP